MNLATAAPPAQTAAASGPDLPLPDLPGRDLSRRNLPGEYRMLGAWRLLLALLVVLQHFQYLLPDAQRGVFHAMGFGVLAVAVFFAISGFIVAEALAGFYAGRPFAFLGNRLLRVVPPYLAALALSVLVHAWLWDRGRLVLWDYTLAGWPLNPHLILASIAALLPGVHGAGLEGNFEFIPFVWSLRVEMAFYLAAFAACLAPRRLPWLPAAIGTLGYAGFAVFLVRGAPGIGGDAPFFLLGVAAYRGLRRGNRLGVRLAFAVALLAFACWDQPAGRLVAAQLPVLAGLLAGFLALAALPASRWRGWDRSLGALSYPLYLNHYVVGILLYDLVPIRGRTVAAAGVVVSLALALAMHRLVEQPLNRLRDIVRGQLL